MGKKSQYWHWSIILIFIMICSVLLQAANQVFAKNPSEIQGENKAVQYVLKKTFDKDKASVELSLDMKEKEKIEIDKVLLPDGKEHAYNGPVFKQWYQRTEHISSGYSTKKKRWKI